MSLGLYFVGKEAPLETNDLIQTDKTVFSPGIDLVSLEKNPPFILIKKDGTGKKGWIMLVFFSLTAAAIIIFSKNWYVPALAGAILLSAAFTVLFTYSALFDLSAATLSLVYRYFFIPRKIKLSFRDIDDIVLKEGETGFILSVVKGKIQTPLNRFINQLPLCRLAKAEEAEALYRHIKTTLGAQESND